MSDMNTVNGAAPGDAATPNNDKNAKLSIIIGNNNKQEDKLAKFEESLAWNTEKKAGSYFLWVKHVSTLAAGALAIVAAMYNGRFVDSVACFIYLMVTMIFFALALYHSLASLLGESAFYAAKCENVWLVINDRKMRKANNKTAIQNNCIDEDYERRAQKALFWFVMGLSSLLLYVIVVFIFNMLQKYNNNTYAEEFLIFVLGLPIFLFGWSWVHRKTKKICIRLNLQNEYDYKDIPQKIQQPLNEKQQPWPFDKEEKTDTGTPTSGG